MTSSYSRISSRASVSVRVLSRFPTHAQLPVGRGQGGVRHEVQELRRQHYEYGRHSCRPTDNPCEQPPSLNSRFFHVIHNKCGYGTDAPHPIRLLRARGERSCSSRTTQKRDECPSSHAQIRKAAPRGAFRPVRIFFKPFRQGLAENGYFEDKNVTLDWRCAEGRFDRLGIWPQATAGHQEAAQRRPGPVATFQIDPREALAFQVRIE